MYENDTISIAIFQNYFPIVHELIVRFGGCHRFAMLGKITSDNIKDRNYEYALRCDPNATKGKKFELWNEFINMK